MKIINSLFLCIILISSPVLFQACGDDDDDSNSEWRQQNEDYFDSFATNPEYQTAEIPGGPGYVYYKILQSGNGATPVEGQDVKIQVIYKGWMMDGTVFDDSKGYTRTFTYQSGKLIDGWMTALAYMKEGDKWNVVIPWTLGYGQNDSGSIPAYSTLIFDIELVKVTGN